jgi:hypothetical protein
MSNICFRSLLLALHLLTLIDAAIVDGPPAGVERPAVTAQRLMQIAWAAESSSVAIVITQPSTVTQQLWQLFQSGQEVIRANGTIALRTWGVFSGTHQ